MRKGAFAELDPLQGKLSGMPEFDYLLGVAALDSARIDDAIIALERVLALVPNHAGAQMDLARAYYAAGSFDLAEAAFVKLREAGPPLAAQAAIARYLDGDVRAGASLNDAANQWRFMGSYLEYRQKGDAPGDPQPTNDRRMAGASVDWRRTLDSKTQLGFGVQVNAVRFPRNEIEDCNQVFLSVSWLRSFERKGVPLLYANSSLHYIFAGTQSSPVTLPLTGTATYDVIGSTSPTDFNGHVGTLNSARLDANFSNRTASAAVDLPINGQTWNGAADDLPIYRDQYFSAYSGTPIAGVSNPNALAISCAPSCGANANGSFDGFFGWWGSGGAGVEPFVRRSPSAWARSRKRPGIRTVRSK